MTLLPRRVLTPPALALLLAASLFSLAGAPACAQTTLTQPLDKPPAAAEVSGSTTQGKGKGLPYLNGGGGSEERADMDRRAAEFPLKLVLSAGKGEYIVAETLRLSNAQGEVLQVKEAGPVLRVKLEPGSYTLEVVYQGKSQRRNLKVGSKAQTVNLRFPG
jgi:hypothetical protein